MASDVTGDARAQDRSGSGRWAAENSAPDPGAPGTNDQGTDDAAQARCRHYGEFYGLSPLPAPDGRRLVVLWGNCQAEAVRRLLQESPTRAVRSVRLPPVHELTAEDLPHVARVLSHADVLLAQPVADGCRDLPLGTAQVARLLPPHGQVVQWPVLFDAALYPFQVLVRHPSAGDPPLVPYHDLRTLLEAATSRRPAARAPAQVYVELARRSVEALATRERHHDTVAVSPELTRRTCEDFHTINHPGNRMLVAAARALQRALGLPVDAVDPRTREPGRILLGSVLTPQEPEVFAALGLEPAPGRDAWLVGGERLADANVRAAHLGFYRRYPGFVDEGLRRHAETIRALQL